jgi:integrase
VPGLYLVVQPSGKKSWAARFRVGHRTRKLTLGSYPMLPLLAARTVARKALGEVAIRGGPGGSQARRRLYRGGRGGYRERHLPSLRPGTRVHAERELGLMLAAWAGRPLKSIIRADVPARIDDARSRGPAAANIVRNRLSAFLQWCVENDMIDTNPAAGIRRPSKYKPRKRVLLDAELAAVWDAADKVSGRVGAFVKLLILTGCRKSEIGSLKWAEITCGRYRASRRADQNRGGPYRSVDGRDARDYRGATEGRPACIRSNPQRRPLG